MCRTLQPAWRVAITPLLSCLHVLRDALHVAVSGAEDRCAEGVVLRNCPIWTDSQDLAVEQVAILSGRSVERVTCADPQVAVGAELQAPAVVTVAGTDAVEYHSLLAQGLEVLGDAQRDDPVGRG